MRKALIMLGELSDGDVDWIAKTAVRRILPAGSVIITEGRELQSLFIILEGQALVTARGVELARLASGDLLGEISMIDKQPPAATVTASGSAATISCTPCAATLTCCISSWTTKFTA